MRLEDEDAKGLYDPGANVSLISTKFFKKLSGKKYIPKSLTYRTISGKEKIKGTVYLKLEIMNEIKKQRFFVVDRPDFAYDALLGLDIISAFRLNID